MRVAAEPSGLLIALYSVGFLMQIGGIALLVLEIVGDVRAARVLRDRADVAGEPATELRVERPGVTTVIGGLGMAPLIQGLQQSDSFREFIADRLSGSLGLRILGVGLVVVGTGTEFAANVISAL